jgi:hypothetical protein
MGSNSSFTSRGCESLTTRNVKTRMVGNGMFSPDHIKVVTEDGTVYPMGIVTPATRAQGPRGRLSRYFPPPYSRTASQAAAWRCAATSFGNPAVYVLPTGDFPSSEP